MRRVIIAILFGSLAQTLYGATVINSEVTAGAYTAPQRVVVVDGADIASSIATPVALFLGGEEGHIDLDIYGGKILGDIVFNVDTARVILKGGELKGNNDDTMYFRFGDTVAEIDVYVTDADPAELGISDCENLESNCVSGVFPDGEGFAFFYTGEFVTVRIHDVTEHDFGNAAASLPICSPSDFADCVVSYDPVGADQLVPNLKDPEEALGIPDFVQAPEDINVTGAVSLGDGGCLVLKCLNNVLVGDGTNAPDLHIFEAGNIVEQVDVEISTDGKTWISVGRTNGGSSSLDIDSAPIDLDAEYRYIRIKDVPEQGGGLPTSRGAEIDAVAILTSKTVEDTPEISIPDDAPAVESGFFQFELSSVLGSRYQTQVLTNDENDNIVWENIGNPIPGTGETIPVSLPTEDEPKAIYRMANWTLQPVAN